MASDKSDEEKRIAKFGPMAPARATLPRVVTRTELDDLKDDLTPAPQMLPISPEERKKKAESANKELEDKALPAQVHRLRDRIDDLAKALDVERVRAEDAERNLRERQTKLAFRMDKVVNVVEAASLLAGEAVRVWRRLALSFRMSDLTSDPVKMLQEVYQGWRSLGHLLKTEVAPKQPPTARPKEPL